MEGIRQVEAICTNHSCSDYRWIDPKEVIVAQWVRMKCMFGCGEYGRNASCPPNVPTISECERFFMEYKKAILFHGILRPETPPLAAGRKAGPPHARTAVR